MIPLFSLKPGEPNYIRNLIKNNDPALKLIAGADSIHDFFDKIRVPPEVFQVVSNNLIKNLYMLSGQKIREQPGWKESDYYTNWLNGMSGNKITSSKVEEQTEAYFENELPQFLLGNVAILTYRQVIDAINNYLAETPKPNNNTAIYKAYKDLCFPNNVIADTIEINMESGENWDTSYSTLDKTFIGLFLLNFFFPPPINTTEPIDVAYNTKKPSYMTFDAGSNIPSKIFGLLDQVVNLVTPLNIADSASEGHHLVVDTSQKRAGVKNRYVFPTNNIENNGYLYNSNIYTMTNNINLYIQKPFEEYGEKNKYNFNVLASKYNNIENSPLLTFTETNGETYIAGPGVKYLANMIAYTPRQLLPTPSNSSIAPIKLNHMDLLNNTIPSKPKALYYDVKRSGDWEQSMAALTINKLMPDSPQKGRVIFCSLDRLSALFSRCIGQNTIYHTGTKLHLFRYQVYLSEAEMKSAQENADRARLEIQAAKEKAEADAQLVIDNEREALASAYDILKNKIEEIINNTTIFKEQGIFLKSPIYINKFKQPTNQYTGLYSMINYFGRILFINSLVKLANANKETDPQKYFNSIGEITGTLINPLNYQNVINNNISKFLLGFQTSSGSLLPQGKFCDYDSKMLTDLFIKLQPIVVFNPDARTSKSIDSDNYKMSLETSGVFSTLELISSDSPPGSSLNDFVTAFKTVQYNENNQCQQGELSKCNKTYYNTLKITLNNYINTLVQTVLQSGGNGNVQRGGELNEEEEKNGSDSLMFELTNEFITLSVDLNEITESIFKVGNNVGGIQKSYSDFRDYMNEDFRDYVNDYYYQDTNKILQILQVFFKNSWDAIKEAEINGIKTTEHKKLYYTIYTFFAFLYGKLRESTNNNIKSVESINSLIKKYSRKIINPTYLNNLNERDEETHKDKKLIVEFLLRNLIFLNDYTDMYDDPGTFQNMIEILLSSDTQVWFTNLITYSLQICNERKTKEFVLTIFTTLLNYFKFCIYYVNIKNNNRISNVNLKDLGFNRGYLIISDFTDKNSPICKLFGKIFRHGIFNPNNNNENESQQNIFKKIPEILSIFSLYFKYPNKAIFQLGQIPRGGSNKYTRKNSNQKKQTKTRKNKNRKNKNRKNTIKNFKMKNKKTKRNKLKKNRK
jgi:hypothetical protein